MVPVVIDSCYEVISRLGMGGMATVYLAKDLKTSGLVAVKILRPEFQEDKQYLERFHREAKMAASLSHKYIVRILGTGNDDAHGPYIVMEYVQGQTLKTLIEQHEHFPFEAALHITRQVAQALGHASEHGVVHRDIKADNIILTPNGTIRVLDFGIARARGLPTMTLSGFVGSPHYISPEQVRGERTDVRSDLYSLGIVLYEMLIGVPPFEADNPWKVVNMHITQSPPELRAKRPDLPAALESFYLRTLAKNAEDRFQHPHEFITALDAILNGTAVEQPVVIPSDPGNRLLDRLYNQALASAQAGRWEWSIYLLHQIVVINPGYKDAAQLLEQARMNGKLPSLYERALTSVNSHHLEQARKELRMLVAIDPNYRDSQQLLEQVEQQVEQAETLFEQGVNHFNEGNWNEAANYLRQAEQLYPGYQDGAELLQEAQRKLPTTSPEPRRRGILERARDQLRSWIGFKRKVQGE